MTANAKNLSTLANVLDDGTNGQFLQSTGSGGIVFADVAAGASVYDSAELLPLSGNDAGDMAYVNSTNRFYINNGSGWYSISLVNTNPNITSVRDAAAAGAGTTPFTLTTDGTATVITVTANDPEDIPLTYGYSVTAGSLTNGGGTTATVAQSDNVFTVTPSTTEAYAGTFSLTFTASDGINTATSANSFTLSFITIVTDSNYTTLLATATPKNATVYRYFKFIPQALRSSSDYQIAEFELTDGSSYYSPTDAEQLYRSDNSDGDDYVAGQNVAASIDGNTSTKVFNGSWNTKYYLYDMGASFNTVLTGWRYITGNDVDGRDPVSWTLLGSTNNSDWVLLDQRVNETITTSRSTATQDFTFNATNQAFFNAANTNYPIEVNGDAHAGTFSPYRSGGYSTFFGRTRLNDPSGDPTEAISATLGSQIGTGDFSVSYWVWVENPSTGPTPSRHFDLGGSGIRFYQHSNTTMRLQMGGGTVLDYAVLGSLSIKSWHYVSITRNSGTLAVHFDGILAGSTTNSTNITQTNFRLGAGTTNDITFGLVGYVRDFMIKNAAVYSVTENYTVPDAVAEPDSNTLILLCTLPYHTDASSNNLTLDLYPVHNNTAMTVAPEIHTFSPYDYVEYTAADHGGSLYFNGTNSAVQIADNDDFDFGTGDLTIECWVYPEVTSNNYPGFLGTSAGWGSIAASGFRFDNLGDSKFQMSWYGPGDPFLETQSTYNHNQWYHFVVTRTGGSTWRMFVNGILEDTGTNSTGYDISIGGNNLQVGGKTWDGGNGWFKGNVADLKLTKGSVVSEYQTTSTTVGTKIFTPRTSPISSSGSELHLKGTDASIIDKSQSNNLKLFGNTTGSTTQTKFSNTKSMYFDGTGDYIPVITDFFYEKNTSNASTTKFTIETWVYHTARLTSSGYNHIFQTIVGLGNVGMSFGIGPSGNLKFYHQSPSANVVTSTSTISLNTWTHIAVIVDGSQGSSGVTLKINGTTDGTGSWNGISTSQSDHSNPYSSPHFTIGRYPDSFQNYQQFQGYLQDLRISNIARTITSAPTASLEG